MRDIHLNDSSVGCTQLFIHKPGDHRVRWYDNALAVDAAGRAESGLLRYFWRHTDLCNLTFEQYYSKFVLQKSTPASSKRKSFRDCPLVQDAKPLYACERTTMHVGRIEIEHNKDIELRAIFSLLRVKPACSFEDLRTVDGVLFSTFVLACDELGIYTGGDDAENVLQELINPERSVWTKVGDEWFPLLESPLKCSDAFL